MIYLFIFLSSLLLKKGIVNKIIGTPLINVLFTSDKIRDHKICNDDGVEKPKNHPCNSHISYMNYPLPTYLDLLVSFTS